ncbi:DNA-3-methyladenine glycosylase 2 family protein [Cohnella pontilimi]|uniref:DNA-3-methyladenine glycosylase II n=1 Tax=Cohnella pontilimi TaxID=2564100 RepID=A0A4U0FHK7_9BACL|nr:DNA-3-methyladenine glycosylase [Cohnella pontilimi]TJY43914.1 DNA-3-methyladenine glycosylase 2 family protein [Cohnella pontilimi]
MNADFQDTMLLTPPKEFRFEQNLAYLSRSPNECLFRVEESVITLAIPAAGQRPIVAIDSPEPDGPLRIRIAGVESGSLPSVREAVAAYIAEWFDWGTDLSPFYAMAAKDPLLSGPAQQFYGLRLVGVPDLFEAVCWAILGQQINLTFAYTLKRRLVETFGSSAEHGGTVYWTFPTAQTVASLNPEQLTALQMTRKKAEYLIGVARLIAEGRLTRDELLASGDVHSAERRLTAIHGIGPWTAHYVAMRCLRFRSAFPIQDVGLHLAMKAALKMDRKPTLSEIRAYADAWAGWESYAVFFLWRTLY